MSFNFYPQLIYRFSKSVFLLILMLKISENKDLSILQTSILGILFKKNNKVTSNKNGNNGNNIIINKSKALIL